MVFAVWKNHGSKKLVLQIRGNRAALGCSIFTVKSILKKKFKKFKKFKKILLTETMEGANIWKSPR